MAGFARLIWRGTAFAAALALGGPLAAGSCSLKPIGPGEAASGGDVGASEAGDGGAPHGESGSVGGRSGSGGLPPDGEAGASANTGGASASGAGGSASGGAGDGPRGGTAGDGIGAGGTGSGSGGSAVGGSTANAGSAGADTTVPPVCQPACGSHKWACWPMPNPVFSGLPNPASYSDLGDVVRDELTCLEWQKVPPTTTYVWEDAIAFCEDLELGDHDDWRLPTRIELTSIVDFMNSPTLDASAFPSGGGGFHKTASDWILTIEQRGAGAGKDYAWTFSLTEGIVSNAGSKAAPSRLRCVRGGGAGEAPSEPAVPPPNLYSVVAEGEVRDNYTGLVWQRAYSDTLLSWEEAQEYCANLGLNERSWRLPSVRELATLVDEAKVAPAIDSEMFPDTQYGARSDNWYWASHRQRDSTYAAWAINYDDGFTGFNMGSSGSWNFFTAGWARCVR